jgi:3-hydroxyacyl-[acyl-carrier-protein] dehydratase
MSVLSKEIKTLFHQIACHEDGRITARITFPETFTGFKGHFPGNPVVPGVCKVLAIVVLLEIALKKKIFLRTIPLAKFMSFVTCNEEVMVELRRETWSGPTGRVKASFQAQGKKVADIQIGVSDEHAGVQAYTQKQG